VQGNEKGVSPVVGVMLMLSVTIIIAAIVSGAAGGFSGTKQNAPSAILEVHFYENRSYGGFSAHAMTIEHISGAPLQTKDLSISTYFRNESGYLIKGGIRGEVPVEGESLWSDFGAGTYSGALFINDQDRFGFPLRSSPAGYKSWFGNSSAVLKAGDLLVTPAQYCTSDSPTSTESHKNPGLNAVLNFDTTNAIHGYRSGAVITMKIVHIPSGQVIFDKDVIVV